MTEKTTQRGSRRPRSAKHSSRKRAHPQASVLHADGIVSRARALVVRVLVFRREGQYLAQGIDYDLTAQAPSEQQAIRSFVRLLKARLKRDAELGRRPLQGVPRAPRQYLEAWDRVEHHRVSREDGISVEPASDPLTDTPPAYVIHALGNAGELGLNR